MKFLTFIRHPESHRQSPPPAALMEAMGKFVERSLKDGTLVDTGGLLPSKDGARVRLANGKITVTDGPFSEAKEVIGGWAILNAELQGRRDPDRHRVHGTAPEALARVRGRVRGAADVRPRHGPVVLRKEQSDASHGDGQGDEELRGRRDAEREAAHRDGQVQRGAGEGRRHAGGRGLHPSAKGKRVRFSDGKKTVIDGPFTETQGARRRLLDLAGQVDGGSRRVGQALPRPDARRGVGDRDPPVLRGRGLRQGVHAGAARTGGAPRAEVERSGSRDPAEP